MQCPNIELLRHSGHYLADSANNFYCLHFGVTVMCLVIILTLRHQHVSLNSYKGKLMHLYLNIFIEKYFIKSSGVSLIEHLMILLPAKDIRLIILLKNNKSKLYCKESWGMDTVIMRLQCFQIHWRKKELKKKLLSDISSSIVCHKLLFILKFMNTAKTGQRWSSNNSFWIDKWFYIISYLFLLTIICLSNTECSMRL